MGILSLLLPALVPALSDGVRGLVAKFTGGAGGYPQNMEERIALMKAETERLNALALLDQPAPGTVMSQWVADLRGAFRYVAVGGIVMVTLAAAFVPSVPAPVLLLLLDLTGASMSFVIGERMYLGLKK